MGTEIIVRSWPDEVKLIEAVLSLLNSFIPYDVLSP